MYALILAGGKGERRKPLTDTLPKPMVSVCGKPLLEHQVDWLKMSGLTDVVFLSGYRSDAIENHFGDGKAFGINAHYSVENSPLGRGGAIKAGLSSVPNNEDTVAVLNGDVITEESLNKLMVVHRERKSDNLSHMATIMVVPMVSPYGLVDIDSSDTIIGFREKVEMEHWINAGVYLFDRSIANELPDLGDHETSTFPRLADAGLLAAVKSRKFWQSVDSFKDLREAEERVGNR